MLKTISRYELLDLIFSREDFKLVDVLNRENYEKEHIKGAISLPLENIEKEAEKFFSKDDLIITYCASFECQASTQAAEKLLKLGYKNVYDYKGGIKDYKEGKLPLEGNLYSKASQEAVCSTC